MADLQIDSRNFNGHTLVLLEDRHKGMLGEQYIIAVEGKSGHLAHKRFITGLGVASAKLFAKQIFADPDKYKSVLGEYFYAYQNV